MNYYIQGDAANADKIKAAFEKFGYDISWPGGCANPDVINIGVERNGAKYVVAETSEYIKGIIKTHPDYKELELPVEPFKVGDWIASIDDEGDVSTEKIVSFTRNKVLLVDTNGCHAEYPKSELNGYHLWTIADAKDGNVLAYQDEIFIARIARGLSVNVAIDYDCCYDGNSFILDSFYSLTVEELKRVYPATKEQRDMLFKKIKEAGYQWDADKKELRKIKPHYDIANFQPKQWVLVRDDDEWEWALTMFSYLSNGSASLFVCINGASFQQCIPFEGNEHLLGTTDMCDECYINW